MRAVARGAGVSHAAPAHHFADVVDLLHAVATDGFTRLSEYVDSLERTADGPWERLHTYGIAYVEFATQNPAEFKVMFRDNPGEVGQFAELKHRVGQEAMQRLKMAIADCAPRREWPESELAQLALLAWCAVHGCAMLKLDGAVAAAKPLSGDSASVKSVVTSIFADLLKSFARS